jgi:hypothetical protein
MKILLLLASLTLTACCATSGASKPPPEPQVVVQTRTVDTACDWTKAIYLDESDVLTDGTAQAILAHNRAGARVCGWKPKRK